MWSITSSLQRLAWREVRVQRLWYLLRLPSGVSKTFSVFNVSMSLSFSRMSCSVGAASEMALVTPNCRAGFFWPSMVNVESVGLKSRATSGVLRRADAEEVATGRVSGWIVVRDGWEMSVIRFSAPTWRRDLSRVKVCKVNATSEVEDASVFGPVRCQGANAPLWLNGEAAASTRCYRNMNKP
jgi:hypothetical protein